MSEQTSSTSNPTQSKYTFHPRPEAHPMKWGELMSPLRRAVRDLLLILDGAVHEVDSGGRIPGTKGEAITANCFLVYGERGTGKSTVLLSAKEAMCDYENFFSTEGGTELQERENEPAFRADARLSAKRLNEKGAIWLDVLDLESLPAHANMLTTVLTRVLYALEANGCARTCYEVASIMEESSGNAKQQLAGLLKDATLMWEDISESSTRDRANRQITAAEIHTLFRHRFRMAMEAFSKELGRSRGRKEETHPIILPIDNIDRSTDHLHDVVKLAQLVASPYLWLVLAGDREDVETFLERAYWKELITIGESAGGVGKVGIDKEDEALVMARRQAATASHKLLPPSHRIEVELVRPDETLEFHRSGREETVYDLLGNIPIPGGREIMSLVDVLDAGRHVKAPEESAPVGKQKIPLPEVKKNRELTHPATLALQLPARGVLDLWQQADRLCNDKSRFTGERGGNDFRAEKIVRTMLRNAIAESKIPNEMGLLLQEKIIHKEPDGTTTLKFCRPNPFLKVTRWRVAEFQRRLHPALLPEGWEQARYAVRSGLAVQGKEEVLVCSLCRQEQPAGEQAQRGGAVQGKQDAPWPSLSGARYTPDELELPPVVAGWLLVLHDVVVEADRSWIVKSNLVPTEIPFVSAQHEVVCSGGDSLVTNCKELWWPAPQWGTYLAYDVFWVRWKEFMNGFKDSEGLLIIRPDCMAWVLAVGWIACVLDTYWALFGPQAGFRARDGDVVGCKVASKLNQLKNTSKDAAVYMDGLKRCEREVIKSAASLYADLMEGGDRAVEGGDKSAGAGDEKVFSEQKRVNLMRDWLEQKMPLLLSHLYVPVSPNVGKMQRVENLETLFKFADLKKRLAEESQSEKYQVEKDPIAMLGMKWLRIFPFIFAEYDAHLAEMFPPLRGAEGQQRRLHPQCLGGFGDLYTVLSSPLKPAEPSPEPKAESDVKQTD